MSYVNPAWAGRFREAALASPAVAEASVSVDDKDGWADVRVSLVAAEGKKLPDTSYGCYFKADENGDMRADAGVLGLRMWLRGSE